MKYDPDEAAPMDVLLTLPDGTDLDGAVVELALVPNEPPFYVTAEVRIPAPAPEPQ